MAEGRGVGKRAKMAQDDKKSVTVDISGTIYHRIVIYVTLG